MDEPFERAEYEPLVMVIPPAMAERWRESGLIEGKHFIVSQHLPLEEE